MEVKRNIPVPGGNQIPSVHPIARTLLTSYDLRNLYQHYSESILRAKNHSAMETVVNTYNKKTLTFVTEV
jgi:trehalose-6-phosphate synthase